MTNEAAETWQTGLFRYIVSAAIYESNIKQSTSTPPFVIGQADLFNHPRGRILCMTLLYKRIQRPVRRPDTRVHSITEKKDQQDKECIETMMTARIPCDWPLSLACEKNVSIQLKRVASRIQNCK